jgi:hypothetical protein
MFHIIINWVVGRVRLTMSEQIESDKPTTGCFQVGEQI